ncbi:MAG: V-type ATP synthase subunit I [Chlamydiae bacterium]|nr:V-type ATP synthase subunit I [Chlamydiota bacterium]
MIIDVRKYLVLGTTEDLDLFFERAQQNGFMEFIQPSTRKSVELPAEVTNLISALKILRKLPLRKKYEGLWEIPYANHVAKRIIELRDEVEKMHEEKRLIEAEIHRVAPFGEFSMEDIDYIQKEGHRKIQFFCMKSAKYAQTPLLDDFIHIATEYDLDYFVGISSKIEQVPGLIEMRIDRSEGELKNHLQFVKEATHDLEVELKSYAGHIDFLQESLLEQLNEYNLVNAKKEVSFPIPNRALFSVEAWVPASKEALIYTLIEGLSVHVERVIIEDHDRMPTHLENSGLNMLGEDLVKIYDIPATTDKDPSGWIFWSFALFFGMIVADGGYGLLYLALAMYLHYKFPSLKGQSKRMLKLLTILSCFVVTWGLLTSSFFGLRIHRKSFLGEISPLQYMVEKKAQYHLSKKDDVYQFWVNEFPALKNVSNGDDFLETVELTKGKVKTYPASETFSDNILLEISLLVGVLHLSFSLLRYVRRNFAGLGWVAFMMGGYLFFPIKLNATSILEFMGWIDRETAKAMGIQLIYSGIGVAVFLALIQRKLKGLAEILNVVQVFADVLSYLRLYALALAGMIMATTFNDMGVAIGLLGGFVVVILGHGVNILLGIMAGVIHGLRLNFIEWYHYSFDGGGRLFKPLKLFKSDEE